MNAYIFLQATYFVIKNGVCIGVVKQKWREREIGFT